jgi:hypothetical protein
LYVLFRDHKEITWYHIDPKRTIFDPSLKITGRGLSNPLIFDFPKNQSKTLAAVVDFQNFTSNYSALPELRELERRN